MKNLSYLKILSLFAFIAIIGCSKNEDPINGPAESLSIVLSSDVGNNELEAIALDQMVTFQVTGSDGENYTSTANLYVDGTEITGPTYTFDTTGTYEVKATYGGATSNILRFDVLANTERALTISNTRAMTDQVITFGLLDSSGEDQAADATFYVNDTAIEGFTFSSSTEGSFEVYAEYQVEGETYTTVTKEFSVYTPKRNVVIEDYTGTWCGYCLNALVAIDDVKELTDHISVVAIHKKSGSFPEPLHFERISELQEEFDVPDGFPQTQLNRTERWRGNPYDYSEVTDLAGTESNVSIGISSQIAGSELSVDVKVVYRNGSQQGDKLVVYLLESGVIADQVNYFDTVEGHPYEGYGNPIIDFVHNDGLRNSLSNLFGDNIPDTSSFEEYKKTYSFNVPSEYNADNLSFVVMVVKADNSAKNSQHAELGEIKTFQ
ncbi:MAG: Omp28-related outer membrane protein [Aequorivita sp.]